ncbi:hypothetical protein SAMN02745664_1314 [Moraxella cuniculi DSM 21768]|uniref:Uncharacterized protein n=1 Tax=Moraxella cuniculi DSM 21768 TaxID=1122245 RepID=A0A1N7GBD4_9GAMM|nr:hypothetical protein [Moraxella cuniculi]OOS02164.1 hypothetical protein B0189_10980 [Moraxella cuniculi]SIS09870.1 hypothetical protein SAMN02745664_1314 [Moraxella cuniculi DSM 21768]
MSANIKCYDPATGRVLFDLASNTSRIIEIRDVPQNTAGEIVVNESGAVFAFWFADYSPYGAEEYDSAMDKVLQLSQSGNRVTYNNRTPLTQKLYIGVASL